MMYTFCRSELMYTKCTQNVSIQNVSHRYFNKFLYTLCIQNVYKMYPTFQQTFVYILYTTFSWHNSFDFVYKMYTKACQNVVYILYKFCINQLYTSCTIFVYEMYTRFPCGKWQN